MANAPLSMTCPLRTMLLTYDIDGDWKEHGHTVWNDMEVVQITESYNEFHVVFIATNMVVASSSLFWWFCGLHSGYDILLDDVSITEYYGDTYQNYMFRTPVEETRIAEATSFKEFVSSGSSNKRFMDWSIKGFDSDTLSYDGSFGLTYGRGSFKQSGRIHGSNEP